MSRSTFSAPGPGNDPIAAGCAATTQNFLRLVDDLAKRKCVIYIHLWMLIASLKALKQKIGYFRDNNRVNYGISWAYETKIYMNG